MRSVLVRHACLLLVRAVMPVLLAIGYLFPVFLQAAPSATLLAEPVYECQEKNYRQFLQANYLLFEVGQVHPLESSEDGQWVYALNSPAGCLEIYRVGQDGLQLASSVAVGLQPVSVRRKQANELWVVNHLSDNISVVDLRGRPRVTRVLQTGDAPFDVVFAGKRAYVSAYARGQHHPTFEPHNLISNIAEFTQGGHTGSDKLGAADLWVYDTQGVPVLAGLVNPFMAGIRSLAVSGDGGTVYAAGFLSGNRTTSINSVPLPTVSVENLTSPARARIVRKQEGQWLDSEGNDRSADVPIDLPDTDVVAVKVAAAVQPFRRMDGKPVTNTNRQLITAEYGGMGSVLFSLAVDGERLLLTALQSHNDIPLQDNLVGKATTNVLVLQEGDKRKTFVLDDLVVHDRHFSLPLPGAILAGKKFIYVASYGSSRIGVFQREPWPAGLSVAGVIDLQDAGDAMAGLSPAGMVELPDGGLVVLSRMDNRLHLLRLRDEKTQDYVHTSSVAMFTPEPQDIVQGRRFLYDADRTGNGKVACGSCHIFGDWDGLVWDLGSKNELLVRNDAAYINTKGALVENMANTLRPLPLTLSPDNYREGDRVPVGRYSLPLCYKGSADTLHHKLAANTWKQRACAFYITDPASSPDTADFNAAAMLAGRQWLSKGFPYFSGLKGPMSTQTLYGLAYGGVMHHTGDRAGAGSHCAARAGTLPEKAFQEFNQSCNGGRSSFVDLLAGRPLPEADMALFSRFVLQMHYPPNPHRPLDNKVPVQWEKMFTDAPIARDITSSKTFLVADRVPTGKADVACHHCHRLDPSQGYFGSATNLYYSAPHVISQDMDIVDFRAFYRKLGFYNGDYREYLPMSKKMQQQHNNQQVSGTGFFHNGAIDPVNAIFNPIFFRYPGDVPGSEPGTTHYDLQSRVNMFYFLSMFPTDVYPAGGQQVSTYQAETLSGRLPDAHCKFYGFSKGQFFSGAAPGKMNDSVTTCYPVLQASGATL